MKSLRLKNIRSLKDTGQLKISPITLLLGQNSSGKSSYLRTFPLLKQSMRTRSNSPILWYGDFVDFGSAEEVHSSFSGSEPICIEMSVDGRRLRDMTYYEPVSFTGLDEVTFSIELSGKEGKTRFESFTVKVKEDYARATIGEGGSISNLVVNGIDFTKFVPQDRFRVTTSELIPQIIQDQGGSKSEVPFAVRPRRQVDIVGKEIRKFYSERLHGRMSEGTITSLARKVPYAPGIKFSETLRKIDSPQKSWKSFVEEITSQRDLEDLNRLRSMYFLSILPAMLLHLDRCMFYALSGVSYVGPSRATGERYYRIQELAVDQIDPQGKNLAMFLHSLNRHEQENFSAWLEGAIGYRIKVDKSPGHIQVRLKEQHSEKFYNIADMGYGFSQVLPIMAQIWSHVHRRSHGYSASYVVMEQPELHLHPGYQAKLADTLVSAIRTQASSHSTESIQNQIKFVIETHSESLINRLGELIYEGKCDANDVSIYLFDKPMDSDVTRVQGSNFNSDGTLDSWPIGFFSAVV